MVGAFWLAVADAAKARGWTVLTPDLPGTSPSSEKIAASWRSRPMQLEGLGITQVSASGGRLTVGVRNLQDAELGLFAQPTLAVATSDVLIKASEGRFFQILRAKPSVIEYRTLTSGDLRDALDAGVDLLVTRSPAVLEYAAAQPEFTTYPLPWSRLSLFVETAGALPFPSLQADSVRASLARDAVHAEARLYSPEQRWNPAACAPASSPSATISPRVVYPENDAVARAIAERVVALSGNDPLLSAVGLTDSVFRVALGRGTERGYVLRFSRSSVSCSDLPPLPGGSTVLPLIETRARAIVRRGSPELAVEWDGTIRILAGAEPGVNP
mgnify:CR=1 FL=1